MTQILSILYSLPVYVSKSVMVFLTVLLFFPSFTFRNSNLYLKVSYKFQIVWDSTRKVLDWNCEKLRIVKYKCWLLICATSLKTNSSTEGLSSEDELRHHWLGSLDDGETRPKVTVSEYCELFIIHGSKNVFPFEYWTFYWSLTISSGIFCVSVSCWIRKIFQLV